MATTTEATQNLERGVVGTNSTPWELSYDGSDLAVLLYPGYSYAARFGSGIWAPLYGNGTDISSEAGVFVSGTFYWDGYPTSGPRRVVRRSGAAGDGDFMAGGDLVDVGGFRTDGTWAVWVERRFTNVDDTWPTSSAVVAARTGGVMDRATWSPRDVSFPPPINHINSDRPLLSHGLYAYVKSTPTWDASQLGVLEIIDLPNDRRLEIAAPVVAGHDYAWNPTVVYLDETYVYALLEDAGIGMELHRYSIHELTGWVPLG